MVFSRPNTGFKAQTPKFSVFRLGWVPSSGYVRSRPLNADISSVVLSLWKGSAGQSAAILSPMCSAQLSELSGRISSCDARALHRHRSLLLRGHAGLC